LCWSLALYRAGNEIGAAKKLRQTMFSNLYLVPRLLDTPIAEFDIWHGSSDAEGSHAEHVHEPYLQLWSDAERDWAKGLYYSPAFQAARERFIEISRALVTTRPGPDRSRLVEEMHKLERWDAAAEKGELRARGLRPRLMGEPSLRGVWREHTLREASVERDRGALGARSGEP
jgi:hypothetical protein